MSGNPEKEPEYFQDVVVPKEEAREPRGFDIDREFGKGTKQRFEHALRISAQKNDDLNNLYGYAYGWYRVLFGVTPDKSKDTARATQKFRDKFEYFSQFEGPTFNDARAAVAYRIVEGTVLVTREKEAGRLKQELQSGITAYIHTRIGSSDLLHASALAAFYRILFDEIPLDHQGVQRAEAAERQRVAERLATAPPNNDAEAAASAALLRILKAREIKFIPGKGIEIIDAPPQPYQQKPIPPMPEERKF